MSGKSNQPLGRSIDLVTWNLGYAGLGQDSDFFKDGGKRRFAPSRRSVQRNLAGILQTLSSLEVDGFLFQETPKTSPINYLTNVHRALQSHFSGWFSRYRRDVYSRFLPWPLTFDHGASTYFRLAPQSDDLIALPLEPNPLHGFLGRAYAMQVFRFDWPDGGGWTIINTHLSAFDDQGITRKAQLDAVISFAQKEYAAGRHVVIGADWNMIIDTPDWPNTSDERFRFWLVEFPKSRLPQGWQILSDPNTPTVRAGYQPYVKGENFTTSIDGFMLSPNVRCASLSALDMDFAYSDHQPVVGRFEAI